MKKTNRRPSRKDNQAITLDMLSKPKRRIIAEMASWSDQSPDRFFLNIVRDEQKKRAREVASYRRAVAKFKKMAKKFKPLTPEETARWKAIESIRKLVRGY
jgi:hypothetical protein